MKIQEAKATYSLSPIIIQSLTTVLEKSKGKKYKDYVELRHDLNKEFDLNLGDDEVINAFIVDIEQQDVEINYKNCK